MKKYCGARLSLKYLKLVMITLIMGFCLTNFVLHLNLHQQQSEKKENSIAIIDHTLIQFIKYRNNEQQITNKYLIDDLVVAEKSEDFLVILVQVNRRVVYLKELIKSLRETRHIEKSLVIFSHDFVSKEINDLIRSIEFCAVN